MSDAHRNSSSAYWLDEIVPCGQCNGQRCEACDQTGFARFTTTEDYLSMVATEAEAERMAAWKKFDICAAARQSHGAGINKTMASMLNVTTRQIRNYVSLGSTFPPESRSFMHEPQLYRFALKADDPVAAVEYALDHEFSPKELKDWITSGKDVTAVVEVREILHREFLFDDILLTCWTQMMDQLQTILLDVFVDSLHGQAFEAIVEITVRGTFPKEKSDA